MPLTQSQYLADTAENTKNRNQLNSDAEAVINFGKSDKNPGNFQGQTIKEYLADNATRGNVNEASDIGTRFKDVGQSDAYKKFTKDRDTYNTFNKKWADEQGVFATNPGHKDKGFSDFLGPIINLIGVVQPELLPLVAAYDTAQAGNSIANGDPLGALTNGLAAVPGIGAGLGELGAVTSATADTIGTIGNAAGGLANAGKAAASGDPIGALTGGLNAIGGGITSVEGAGTNLGKIGEGITGAGQLASAGNSASKGDIFGALTNGIKAGATGSALNDQLSSNVSNPDISSPDKLQGFVNNQPNSTNITGVDNSGNPSALAGGSTPVTGGYTPVLGQDNKGLPTGVPSEVKSQGNNGPSGLTKGLQTASNVSSGAGGLAALINGLQQPKQVQGTNTIQTPVTGAQAANVPNQGSWTDRQLYDKLNAIRAKFQRLGQSGSQAEQQALMQAQREQVG